MSLRSRIPPTIPLLTATRSHSRIRQVPVTTIYEQIVGQPELQRRLESLAVADFTISGRAREVAQIQANLVGSGKTTNGTMTIPGLTPLSVLDMGGLTFKLGTQGNPTDLTERLIDFSVHVTQGLDAQNAYVPGGGIYASRMWMGVRRATFEAQLFVDSGNTDILDYFLNATILEASFKLTGDKILGSQPETHDCTILFPAVRISAAPITTQGDVVVYRISAGEENVYKDAGGTPNEPVQMTVTNNVASYLTA